MTPRRPREEDSYPAFILHLELLLSNGIAEWERDTKMVEGIEVADGEMAVGESADDHGLLVRIGTRTWRIEATEVTP